jgi:pyruvate/2-oxoglutarate/acetoin dehydrogenase E1 component
MVDFPVLDPQTPEEVLDMYRYAKESDGPVMIVEHKKFH